MPWPKSPLLAYCLQTQFFAPRTLAVINGISVGDRSVGAGEIITDQIGTIGDQAALAEAAAEGRVEIVDTSVDNSNLDTLASNTGFSECVDLGHQVRSEGVLGAVTLSDDLLDGAASGVNGVFGDRVAADRVHGLDTGHGTDLGGEVLGLVEVLELEGGTLEELMANVLADGGIALDRVEDRVGLSSTQVVSIGYPSLMRVSHNLRGYPRTRRCRHQGWSWEPCGGQPGRKTPRPGASWPNQDEP